MGSSKREGTTKRRKSSSVLTDPEKVCLIICPCGKPGSQTRAFADDVYMKLILPSVNSLHLVPKRIDQISPKGDINSNLASLLLNAPLCIGFIDDHNPNVMIETGIRLAYDKPIVLLKTGETELPFDIHSLNCIEYDLSNASRTRRSINELSRHLRNPPFHGESVFSKNLAVIGADYELLPTSRAKLLRLDRLIEDFNDFMRDIELDDELDSVEQKKRASTRRSHEGKLVAITDRLRHELTLLKAIFNESSPGALRNACEAFIDGLQELQRSSELLRKKLLAPKGSTKQLLLRSTSSLIEKADTIRRRNGHIKSAGKSRRVVDANKKN